jgi:6-phosphogluconolactonase
MKVNITKYTRKEELDEDLANEIASALKKLILVKENAFLLLSGGTTPMKMYKLLSGLEVDWKKVKVFLVDERFVPVNNEFSNEKAIRQNFLINSAAESDFYGLVYEEKDQARNLEIARKIYSKIYFDAAVIVLGMGADGHFASLFPNDESSEIALNDNTSILTNTQSPALPQNRISLSGPAIVKGKYIFLMMTGDNKLEVLENSEENKLPISYLLKNRPDTKIYFAS